MRVSIASLFVLAFVIAACSGAEQEPTEISEPTLAPTEVEVLPTDEPTSEPEPTVAPETEEVIPADQVTVSVIDSTYLLQVITVPVGTTVTWEYNGGLPHTVTSDDNLFNSGTLGEGDTFSFTFTEEGTFPYYCRFHGAPGGSGMSGVVEVTGG